MGGHEKMHHTLKCDAFFNIINNFCILHITILLFENTVLLLLPHPASASTQAMHKPVCFIFLYFIPLLSSLKMLETHKSEPPL